MLKISLTKAASACSIGKKKKATATPVAKTTAVKASVGSFVLLSKSHVKTIPKITNRKLQEKYQNHRLKL